jgi:hypothetical protein
MRYTLKLEQVQWVHQLGQLEVGDIGDTISMGYTLKLEKLPQTWTTWSQSQGHMRHYITYVGHIIGKGKSLVECFIIKAFGLPVIKSVSSYEITATNTECLTGNFGSVKVPYDKMP